MSIKIPNIPKIGTNEIETIISYERLPLNLFNKINEIINTYITSDNLIEFMKSQKVPPIRDLKSKKLIVDESKRSCRRFTFGKDIIKYFIPDIEKYLKHHLKLMYNIDNVEIDKTHGDILYYDNCGFFNKHKDQVPEKETSSKFKNHKWAMYTLIVYLDTTQTTNNGNTIIWTVDDNFNKKQNCGLKYLMYGYNCVPHSFKLNKGDMLLFQSDVVHEASALLENEMTLKLKLDVWLKVFNKNMILIFSSKNNDIDCKCVLCKPKLTYRKKIILKALNRLDKYLQLNILEYIDFFKINDRCLYKYFNINKTSTYKNNKFCSCIKCISHNNKYNVEYNNRDSYDYYDENEYEMCNGYDLNDMYY